MCDERARDSEQHSADMGNGIDFQSLQLCIETQEETGKTVTKLLPVV